MKLSKTVGKNSAGARQPRALKTRAYRKFMTALAIIITMMPIITVSYWVYSTLHDSRPTQKLSHVSRSSTDLTPFSQPMISITFDDGWESAYKNAAPVLSKYNIPTTFYVITDTFDQPQYISPKQIKSLSETGHEIESHTASHPDLTQVEDRQLNYELSHSKEEIQKITNKPVVDFSSPLDAYNDQVVAAVKNNGYRSHRTTDATTSLTPYNINLPATFDPYHIQAYTIRSSTKLEDLRNYLNYAKQNNAWVVLVYHQVEPSAIEVPDKDRYGINLTTFEAQMKLVSESNMHIATMEQALDAIAKLPPKATKQGDVK